MTLFKYKPREHIPQDVNILHRIDMAAAGFNQNLAFMLSSTVETMWTTYIFTGIAFIGLLGLLNLLPPIMFLLMTWLSQQFLQLVYLPIITVKQGVQEKKQAMMAEQQFKFIKETYDRIDQMIQHMHMQDKVISAIAEKQGINVEQLIEESS